MTPFLLLALGLLLVFLEFYLPGAILGIGGGIMIFISIVYFAMESQSVISIVAYIVLAAFCVAGLIKFALWRIRTAKPDRSIYSDDAQVGFQASTYDTTMVGKQGVVLTDLKPGGHISIEGKRLQAISRGGYVTKGTEVTVIGGQEESLIVKPVTKETHS